MSSSPLRRALSSPWAAPCGIALALASGLGTWQVGPLVGVAILVVGGAVLLAGLAGARQGLGSPATEVRNRTPEQLAMTTFTRLLDLRHQVANTVPSEEGKTITPDLIETVAEGLQLLKADVDPHRAELGTGVAGAFDGCLRLLAEALRSHDPEVAAGKLAEFDGRMPSLPDLKKMIPKH